MPPVHRIEVRAAPGRADPRGESIVRRARGAGVEIVSAAATRVYFIEAELSADQLRLVRERLLTDPVTESSSLGAADRAGRTVVEVHPLPGVMDPAAQSVREAIEALVGVRAEVSSGARYDLAGVTPERARELARRWLANPAIHSIHAEPWRPTELPRGREYALAVREVPIRVLDDDALALMSRRAHLFLSLDEMRAIRDHYRALAREPRDVELETIAQTWSEHCVHKTLKSRIAYRAAARVAHDPIGWQGRPGHVVNSDGSVTIDNLLKSTVAAATFELIAGGVDWTLSVFKDNSGVIALDDEFGVCVKVETHNHPSAIEPYGGAATGAGGCIRDVIGTGLGARPIASTDVFCVAHPNAWREGELPPGCLDPRRILTDVVAGVRDYGNRMGIPTVNGAVAFDDRYVGNPLVFCGCVGLIPRGMVTGAARGGDRIVLLGGRTGRDGIHGATFSSAELEHTAADEFAHAVQIGNAIEEKRVLDAILRARGDGSAPPLFHAITDCGAGGLSSAIGEMGSELGASVDLDRVPTKYTGLSYTEIWISEAQERMVLAVPAANLESLRAICREEQVELADLGEFGTPGRELVLSYAGTEVGRLSCAFLADGLPQPMREAFWPGVPAAARRALPATTMGDLLLRVLSHPNIASKHWIVRQYDHEVQGNTVVKPLVGPGAGPGDASVIEPVAGSGRGIAIGCGLRAPLGSIGGEGGVDPYRMALAAIDECVRNLVCVGASPDRIAILDNFCWPSCQKPENLASLVRAAEGCYDGAKSYKTPFVSGKDSLNNQLRYVDDSGRERLIEIPPTLLITGVGIVPDVSRCATMDAKRAGNVLVLVGPACESIDGSHAASILGDAERDAPRVDLAAGPAAARAVARVIGKGLARSAHDVTDGGLLACIAEMLIAAEGAGLGAGLELSGVDAMALGFGESPSRYVLEVEPGSVSAVLAELAPTPAIVIGRVVGEPRLAWVSAGLDVPVAKLSRAWRTPLDW